ncbi:DUF5050 domain-containing protein [Brevibacillus sp. H7]|uniref:DUF5050 domain-containing protein n=1 Tax=Brevibacillus sp. H7 TaxID=3349138 RepID=UPI0037F22FA0
MKKQSLKIVLCILLLLNLINTVDNVSAESIEKGNTSANNRDVGFEIERNGWIYFVDNNSKSNNRSIYKMKSDKTGLKKLTNGRIGTNLNLVGDWLYYFSFFGGINRVKIDGSASYSYNVGGEELNVIGNWMYYINPNSGSKIYKHSVDNKKKIVLENRISDNLNVVGNWIYYSVGNAIYKMKLDGSQKTKLRQEKYIVTFMIVDESGKNIFYNLANGGLLKLSTDGKIHRQLIEDLVGSFNEFGDWIYFTSIDLKEIQNINSRGNNSLYRMKKDGTSRQLLSKDGHHTGLTISGGWLYYSKKHTGSNDVIRYRMKLDGTKNELFLYPGQKNPVISSMGSGKLPQNTTYSMIVDGKIIDHNQGVPIYRSGLLYLPIEPIVRGMSDTFNYIQKPYTATITKKDGTEIEISVSKSTALVDGKIVPLSKLMLEGTEVPIQAKPIVFNSKLYVPNDFVNEIVKYPLKIDKGDNITKVIIGIP